MHECTDSVPLLFDFVLVEVIFDLVVEFFILGEEVLGYGLLLFQQCIFHNIIKIDNMVDHL